jgi:hypothetical protein
MLRKLFFGACMLAALVLAMAAGRLYVGIPFVPLTGFIILSVLAAGSLAYAANRAWVGRWFSALCAIPWLVTLSAYAEACAARLVLSRWPRPMSDDPKQLATAPLHLVFQVLFLSLIFAIPLMITWVMRNWRKVIRDWRYSVRLGLFVVGVLAFWTLTHYDPGHVWDWFFD